MTYLRCSRIRKADSRMSLRNLADSGRIKRHPVTVGDPQKKGVFRVAAADEIDGAAQQRLEAFHQPEVSLGKRIGVGVELEEEIDIAFGGIKVAAGGRTKYLKPLHALGAAEQGDLVAMFFEKFDHR